MPIILKISNRETTLYTRQEAAKTLGVSYRTMGLYIRQERIPAQLIRGRWYVEEQNLLAFLHGAKFTAHGYSYGRGRNRATVEAPRYTAYEADALIAEHHHSIPEDYSL